MENVYVFCVFFCFFLSFFLCFFSFFLFLYVFLIVLLVLLVLLVCLSYVQGLLLLLFVSIGKIFVFIFSLLPNSLALLSEF